MSALVRSTEGRPMSAPAVKLLDAELRGLAARVPDLSQPGLAFADVEVLQDSPLCGDQVHLQAQRGEGRFLRWSARAEGCVLCLAATQVVTSLATGGPLSRAHEALQALDALWQTAQTERPLAISPDWAPLGLFEPLRAHRNRRHCVRLPFLAWCALADAAPPPG